MTVVFTTHNIRLDDGTFTYPEIGYSMTQHPWLLSTQRLLNIVFPGDKTGLRLVDLGCLEGGYSVEFARMGFQVVGIEVRANNMAACRYVKERVHLPNLEFVLDDAWNVASYGSFDVAFCCGLLYHLDQPKRFLHLLSTVTRKLLIVQTHFATQNPDLGHSLSPELTENEGLLGRWYEEFPTPELFSNREGYKYSSWDNRRSFWIQREHLLQAIGSAGFDVVMEQFDDLGPGIAQSMLSGGYKTEARGTFVGIRAKA